MLFQIGVFPWVMIALTPIFFAPDWPMRVAARSPDPDAVRARRPAVPTSRRLIGRATVALLVALGDDEPRAAAAPLARDGDVRFNDDGYYLSWRVMLTERRRLPAFDVTDPATGEPGGRAGVCSPNGRPRRPRRGPISRSPRPTSSPPTSPTRASASRCAPTRGWRSTADRASGGSTRRRPRRRVAMGAGR